jgi:hypothetical protein
LFAIPDITIELLYVEDKVDDVMAVLLHVIEEENVPEVNPATICVRSVSLDGLIDTGVDE